MLLEKEDLALSLSLSSSANRFDRLGLVPSSSSSPSRSLPTSCQQWSRLLLARSEGGGAGEARRGLRTIDVNQPPPAGAAAGRPDSEEADASSPNSGVSTVGGKRPAEREAEHDAEPSCSRGASDEEEGDGDGDGSRKKLRLSKDQSVVLEESFKEHTTLSPKQKLALAKQLNLRPRQVEVWFQNRRARTKLKQTEVDCEFLKRCCENLTEENRRLQKEVQELRALKLSPQLYMQMTPPTTLTMCPSCERVSKPSFSTTSTTNPPPTEAAAPRSLRPPFLDAPPQR
ncbi:hypothetical protein C4D60_Mb05t04450 [Musa balbisiana]|uniref:Homeobox domain-containing protein n=1 Tax=Musa balbisiana TaxID=52838 RepID=A0A4S8JTM2_MUSBA|nr:hypothetical protein C4D60_Mb05t04450 [Musa balbisiana]